MEKIILKTKGVSIEFPGVKALSDINFEISTGKIHAILGANGAGKSTLMKVLAGANPNYTGEIYLNDKHIDLRTPLAANAAGIQIVYQEVDTALVPYLSVTENIMLSKMVNDMGHRVFINRKRMKQEAKEALAMLDIHIPADTLAQDLSLAQKQMVLIARAIQRKCNFLILDEPTAPLSDNETKKLFTVVQNLVRTQNMSVLFISHRLNEVLSICDSYTIMRNGKIVDCDILNPKTKVSELIEKMLGRKLSSLESREKSEIKEKMLEIDNMSAQDDLVKNISLYARKGEIIGIAGLVGAGKSELCKTIFGIYQKKSGKIKVDGHEVTIKNPEDALRYKIALVPEERRKEGILVSESVSFNLSAASLSKFCRFSFIRGNKVTENANRFVRSLGIKTPNISQKSALLSGGNQQKVVVGKWLAADCDIYIFDEPTKGVDIGSKQDMFSLICDIARKGNTVIYASCENAELLSITDRIYVMFDGKIQAELMTQHTDEDEIMHYSIGNMTKYIKS